LKEAQTKQAIRSAPMVERTGQARAQRGVIEHPLLGEPLVAHAASNSPTTNLSQQDTHDVALRVAYPTIERLRAMIDSTPALLCCAGADGSVEYANEFWREYTGLSLREACNWGWTTALHESDRTSIVTRLRSSFSTGQADEVEGRLRRTDGEHRWFLLRWRPEHGKPGEIVGWSFCMVDIDDRRRAQSRISDELDKRRRADEATRNSATDFRLTLDSMPGMVCLHSTAGAIELVNESLFRYTGRTLAELQDWPAVIHPDDRAHVVELWRHSLSSGAPFDADLRVRDAQGSYQWFHCRGRALRDDANEIVRWYNLLTDIQDRKQAEEAQRASEENSRLILDNIAGFVTTHAASGAVVQVNGPFLEYTGGTLESVKNDPSILHPDERGHVLHQWRRSLAKGEALRTEARLRRADGAFRWFNITAVPFRNTDGQVVRWYSLLTDIDDRKRAEEALTKAQNRLERAMQIATVSELAAAIAHEVTQPITAIVANGHACIGWLSSQPPNLSQACQTAEQIVQDGLDAGEVVQRVRALFKQANVEKSLLDLNQLILEVVRLVQAEAQRRGASVTTDLAANLPSILGNRLQLQQVLLNLMHNGLDAMESVVSSARRLSIRSRPQGVSEVLIQIQDQGVGVQHPDKAFDPFFTTKEHGMGMGLAICRSVVDAHNGRLWIASDEEPGATLCVALPVEPSWSALQPSP